MRATDVKPSRIAAAQEAARAFVAEQPKTTRIGVVSFAATASVVQSPTHSREDILAAIERFQLQRGTAVGSGILVALKMIFPDAGIRFALVESAARGGAREPARSRQVDADKSEVKNVPPGSYSSAAIILLTDGQTTTGPDPIESARMAADRGIRVYTVGIGTQGGETIGAEGWSMRVRLDEQSLKTIANLTQGEYFYAGTATDLQKIYKNLNTKLFFEQKETEISALFAAVAAGSRWCRDCCRYSGSTGSSDDGPLSRRGRSVQTAWRVALSARQLIAAFHCCGEMASSRCSSHNAASRPSSGPTSLK
jgi:Ca-activated chloride channel family protein